MDKKDQTAEAKVLDGIFHTLMHVAPNSGADALDAIQQLMSTLGARYTVHDTVEASLEARLWESFIAQANYVKSLALEARAQAKRADYTLQEKAKLRAMERRLLEASRKVLLALDSNGK